jgi:hypothetical protein
MHLPTMSLEKYITETDRMSMQSIWATSAGQGSGAKVEVSVDILRESADLEPCHGASLLVDEVLCVAQ